MLHEPPRSMQPLTVAHLSPLLVLLLTLARLFGCAYGMQHVFVYMHAPPIPTCNSHEARA